MRPRLCAPRLAWAGLVALGLFACAANPYDYDAYRAAHPGWEPALPDAPAGLAEVVAALHAPDAVPNARVELKSLAVLDVSAEPWRSLDLAALQDAAPGADYAVIARRDCRAGAGSEADEASRVDYYLIRRGQVEAYAYSDFHARCEIHERFRAARGESVALESSLTAHIQDRHGRRQLDLAQTYRRGLGYVEAGRLAEAHAMLRLGDRGYRDAVRRQQRKKSEEASTREERKAADQMADVSRLRGNLQRALGVAPGDP